MPQLLPPQVDDLGELRRGRGLTQIDLARMAGCSVSYIRQLEQGGLPLRPSELLRRITSILNDQEPAANGLLVKKGETTPHVSTG